MPFEHLPNPTGKGAPDWGVSALALDDDGARVAAVQHGLGAFFDPVSGRQGVRWKDAAAPDVVRFLPGGDLLVVGGTLARVDREGRATRVGKRVFAGEAPPRAAALAGDLLVAPHAWEAGDRLREATFGVRIADGAVAWKSPRAADHVFVREGDVTAVHGDAAAVLDPATGRAGREWRLPCAPAAVHADADGLWLGADDRVLRVGADGAVAAVAEGLPGAVAALVRVGDRLVVGLTTETPGPFPDAPFVRWALRSLDAQALGDPRSLPLGEAAEGLGWGELVRVQALLAVEDTLWVGTERGLLRGPAR